MTANSYGNSGENYMQYIKDIKDNGTYQDNIDNIDNVNNININRKTIRNNDNIIQIRQSLNSQGVQAIQFTPKPIKSSFASNSNYNLSWELDLYLNDIKLLFEEIIEIKSNKNFSELSKQLRKISKIISLLHNSLNEDKQYSDMSKNISNNISNNSKENTYNHKSERISVVSIASIKSARKNSAKSVSIVEDLINHINELFKPPYMYVMYSDKFRDMFKLGTIFEEKMSANSCNMVDLDDNMGQNSNKSILENLLS